jgi:hypothetical protein
VSDPIDPTLDNCGCCEPDPAPAPIYNRPGLPALSYRAGTYAAIFRRMLARIGGFTLQDGDFIGTRPLAGLTTRRQDDPSIALLDASAVVADVLTFYQERIANEGFLRTATERRSVLEMARAIGYELNPGVAATVYVAFTVEDAQGAPGVSTVPAGTQVKSIPPQGKLPQTFETSAEITARKEWNAMRPRLSETQDLTSGFSELYLQGTGANLKAGDLIVVVHGSELRAAHVAEVEVDSELGITRVTLAAAITSMGGEAISLSASAPGEDKVPFDAAAVAEHILQMAWADDELNAFLQANEWDPQVLVEYLESYREENPGVVGSAFALRTRVGIYGHNAPKWKSLPASQRYGEWVIPKKSDGAQGTPEFKEPAYPNSWAGNDITTDSQGEAFDDEVSFYLDRTVPGLQPGGYTALESPTTLAVYVVTSVVEASLSDYAMSAKVTGLQVTTSGAVGISLESFKVRRTTVHVQSEPLAAAELPLTGDLEAGLTSLELDRFAYGLKPGQAVTLSGERADADGLVQSEILIVKDLSHNYGLTTLVFESGLQFSYKRSTVTLNANTVQATHGETVSEVLGGGDGGQVHQKFTLKKPPLTFTPAATSSGSESTLELRVNNLLWDQAASLYGLGPADEEYILRLDDDGKPTVLFGDGLKGARLPTGQNNVAAVYRSGIGLEGQVEAGSLTLLPSRPFGIRGAVNPLAASGAGDPERMDDARSHAPLTVRTLDRVVSRQDYEDFAAAFAGVGKAQAVDLWDGEQHLVHVTIAGEDGEPVQPGDFRDNFTAALDQARDPAQRVRVGTFDKLLFDVKANLAVDRRYTVEEVLAEARSALEAAFAFERRAFGQAVTAAEVMTIIQGVEGVVYVDIDLLHLSEQAEALDQILPARIAGVVEGQLEQAQLLLINELGIVLQEVQA